MTERERWATRAGLILAMAGNAIGLGNFLRFPTQVAANGGGAYMIPYFISLLLLGIPLMWMEWALGRYGGSLGHGTAPGVFGAIWKKNFARYIGVLGLFIPFVIVVYYTWIESWTFAFSFYSFAGFIPEAPETESLEEYLKPYEGVLYDFLGVSSVKQRCLWGVCIKLLGVAPFAYLSFILVLFINLFILWRGVSGGIEKFARFAMPLLFIMAVLLVVRVFTLESPIDPKLGASEGLGFMWNPKIEGLFNPEVWLNAAGQIFFSLSIGIGIILTYASYIRRRDDIALSGLTTASLNELAEVVLGASIAIPAAVIFFGIMGAESIAKSGAFRLAFVSMPAIFSHTPFGDFFGGLWFLLLFFGGITSSIALAQPFIAILQDEFGWTRKKAVLALACAWFLISHVPIFLEGALDEMDFWAGTLGLVVFALFEVWVFLWVFGSENAWREINIGAKIKIPRFFLFVMKYISPLYLIAILATWVFKAVPSMLAKTDPNTLITRFILLAILILFLSMAYSAWGPKPYKLLTRRKFKG
jgi:SNF family Na+-dependent transporter